MASGILITCASNCITLDDSAQSMKSFQMSQLSFWGFHKNGNQYERNGDSSQQLLEMCRRVTDYLQKENVNFELDSETQFLIDEYAEQEVEFERRLDVAKQVKEGKIPHELAERVSDLLDNKLARKLKQHQERALYHFLELGSSANFSVPGSGKTSVVLAAFELLRLEGKVNVLYVVGPPACFGPWKNEFRAVLGREPRALILSGRDKASRLCAYGERPDPLGSLYLTTFQTLLNDVEETQQFFGRADVSPLLVIDEAHYIKQVGGKWAGAVLALSSVAMHRCVLTGTPMPRSYADLFNYFTFLYPSAHLLSSEEKSRILLCEESRDEDTPREIIQDRLSPAFIRVTKQELGLMAPVFNPPILVEMKENEKKVYEAIVSRIRAYAQKDYLHNIDLVEKLRRGRMIRLRQSVSNTALLSTAIDDYKEEILEGEIDLARLIARYESLEVPGKIDALIVLVNHLRENGEKVVIWSNFIGSLHLIKTHLNTHGHNSKMIFGATPVDREGLGDVETRERIRDEFVDPNSGLDVLIANPAACSESISLHKTCQHAIYYDLSYNCAQYLQSLDRIHRVGGSELRPAYYHFLQYKNTIDGDILQSLLRKSRKMYKAMEDDYALLSLDMFDDSDELSAYQRLFDSTSDD